MLATVTAATELPVVAGLPGRTTAVAVEQARGCLDAASRPLRAVMVQAHTANADVLVEHLQQIHRATEALRATLDAYAAGGFSAAREAWAPWLPLANFEGQVTIGLALRKEILRRRGILTNADVRPPAPGVPAHLLPVLAEHLATLPTLASMQEV